MSDESKETKPMPQTAPRARSETDRPGAVGHAETRAGGRIRPRPYADDDEQEEPWGDPADLRNEGPLKSLGEAISEPVRDAPRRPPDAPGRTADGDKSGPEGAR